MCLQWRDQGMRPIKGEAALRVFLLIALTLFSTPVLASERRLPQPREMQLAKSYDLNPEGFCYEVENSINAMIPWTYTKCLPAAGTKPGTQSIILISEKAVFFQEQTKKGWLAAAVGAVGYVANQHDKQFRLTGDVIVSDVNHMKNRPPQAWRLPANTVKALQRRISNDEINANQFLYGIYQALVPFEIPATKR